MAFKNVLSLVYIRKYFSTIAYFAVLDALINVRYVLSPTSVMEKE